MLEFYLAMIGLTALFLFRAARPKRIPEWAMLIAMSAFWPALVAWIVYDMIRCGWSWERGAGEEKDG